MASINKKLEKILVVTKWTRDELARKLTVPYRTLYAWLNGKATPRAKNVEKVNDLYNDVVGRKRLDPFLLADKLKRALAKRLTVKELITNEELLDKITLHLTYHTNTIEGSTMTLADVREALSDTSQVLVKKTAREQTEARNHRAALYYLLDKLNDKGKKFVWTEGLILNAHLRLMNTLISNAGIYRHHGVRITGSYLPLEGHRAVPGRMKELLEYVNVPTNKPIEQMAWTHATFEQIHPFGDGNGRIGRLIMFIQALQHDLVPPVISEERRRAYYKYLELAQLEGKYALLAMFIAESIISADRLVRERDAEW
jgi:Fic family protein